MVEYFFKIWPMWRNFAKSGHFDPDAENYLLLGFKPATSQT